MRGCLSTVIVILAAVLAVISPPTTITEYRFEGTNGSGTLILDSVPDGVYSILIEADGAVSAQLAESEGCNMSVGYVADIKPPFDIVLTVDNCTPEFIYNSFSESWVMVLQQTNP